jgi:hypothetical protein
MSRRAWVAQSLLGAGASLLVIIAAQSFGFFGGSSPRIAAPCSLLLAIPVLLFGPLSLILPGVAYYFWALTLLRRLPVSPLATEIPALAIALLSLAGFVSSWRDGVQYEGYDFARGTALASGAFAVLTGILAMIGRRWRSLAIYGVLRFVLVAWVSTYAFPWLGETL